MMHIPPSETDLTAMPYAPETNTTTSTTPLLEKNPTTTPPPETSDSAGFLSASNPTAAPSSETDPAVTSSSTHSFKLKIVLFTGGYLMLLVLCLLLLYVQLHAGVVVQSAIAALGFTCSLARMLVLELRNNNALVNLSCMTFFFLLFFLSYLLIIVVLERVKEKQGVAQLVFMIYLAMMLWVKGLFVSVRFGRYLLEGNGDGLERLKRAFRIGPARAHRSQEVELDRVAPYESV